MDTRLPKKSPFFDFLAELNSIVILFVWMIFYTLEALIRIFIKPSKKPLTDQKVLVTGAALGLGKALALELSKRGATLILWDIKETELNHTKSRICNDGGKATAYICDVSQKDEVKKISEQVFRDHGYIDILVNNAGTMITSKPFISNNHQDICRTIDVNLMGNFWTIQAFLPHMLAREKGHIVAVCSMAGRQGFPNTISYCTSKFGVSGLMESLSEELRNDSHNNIHITTVYPGAMNTPLFNKFNANWKRPWMLPIIEPAEAAKTILDGIQRNASSIFVPSFAVVADLIFRISPRKIKLKMSDFFGFKITDKE